MRYLYIAFLTVGLLAPLEASAEASARLCRVLRTESTTRYEDLNCDAVIEAAYTKAEEGARGQPYQGESELDTFLRVHGKTVEAGEE